MNRPMDVLSLLRRFVDAPKNPVVFRREEFASKMGQSQLWTPHGFFNNRHGGLCLTDFETMNHFQIVTG